MDKHQRLRLARVKAGFASAAEAARAMGVREVTYSSHENGYRQYDDQHATTYARRFRVSPVWLLFGQGEMDAPPPDLKPEDLTEHQAAMVRATEILDDETMHALAVIIEALADRAELKAKSLRAAPRREREKDGSGRP